MPKALTKANIKGNQSSWYDRWVSADKRKKPAIVIEPRFRATLKTSGGRYLASGEKVTVFEEEPPKARVIIQAWNSVEKIQAWRDAAEFWEACKTGEKYAKFPAYAIQGVAPSSLWL